MGPGWHSFAYVSRTADLHPITPMVSPMGLAHKLNKQGERRCRLPALLAVLTAAQGVIEMSA
jgi:hypothetical protein